MHPTCLVAPCVIITQRERERQQQLAAQHELAAQQELAAAQGFQLPGSGMPVGTKICSTPHPK